LLLWERGKFCLMRERNDEQVAADVRVEIEDDEVVCGAVQYKFAFIIARMVLKQ
jgi:hypothetical protein